MWFIAFAGFLLFSEIVALRCKDSQTCDTYMSLHISKSKTDQYRDGQSVVIHGSSRFTCPVSKMEKVIVGNRTGKGDS